MGILLSAEELGGGSSEMRIQVVVDCAPLGAEFDLVGHSHVDELSVAVHLDDGVWLGPLSPGNGVIVNHVPGVVMQEVVAVDRMGSPLSVKGDSWHGGVKAELDLKFMVPVILVLVLGVAFRGEFPPLIHGVFESIDTKFLWCVSPVLCVFNVVGP